MKMIRGIFIIFLFALSVQNMQSATGIPLQDLKNCLKYGFYSIHGQIGLGLVGCSAVVINHDVCPKIYTQIMLLAGCASYMYGIYKGIKTVKSVIDRYLSDCNPEIICSCRKKGLLTVFYGKPNQRYGKTSIWMRNYKMGVYTTIPIAAHDEYRITMCDGFIKINDTKYPANHCSHV